MIQKKICMLGSFAVGKTSLVARYVRSVFSEKYLTTIGVKVDKKVVTLGDGHPDVSLLLWDILFTIVLWPVSYLLNKVDLVREWTLSEKEERQLAEQGPVIRTSAKTGQGVEEAFQTLTLGMLRTARNG